MSVRADLLFDEDGRSSALYGGLKLGPRPAMAARRTEMLGVAEVDQRVEAGNRLEHDVAALAAVAAVRAAIFDELLAPEADRAGAAGA